MRMISLPCISALKEQPTPQYAQVVTTLCSPCPFAVTDFSINVAVGQACTQAPHETHSEFRKSVPPAETFDANPRPSIVNANVPCTSSQARTHREHTMHLEGSKLK